jgi:hypothetical protein
MSSSFFPYPAFAFKLKVDFGDSVFNHYNRIRAKLQREALEDPPISPGWRDNMAADSDSDRMSFRLLVYYVR